MTALRWPERELVDVPAEKVWYEPSRPLRTEAPGGQDGRPLDLGPRPVELGEVVIRAAPDGSVRQNGTQVFADCIRQRAWCRLVRSRRLGALDVRGRRVVAIVSGGNIDREKLASLLNR